MTLKTKSVLLLLAVLAASPAAQASEIRAKFPDGVTWQESKKHDGIHHWEFIPAGEASDPDKHLSLTARADVLSAPAAFDKATDDDVKNIFQKGRQISIKDFGYKNWKIQSMKRLKVNKPKWGEGYQLSLTGSYTDPQGADIQFEEVHYYFGVNHLVVALQFPGNAKNLPSAEARHQAFAAISWEK